MKPPETESIPTDAPQIAVAIAFVILVPIVAVLRTTIAIGDDYDKD